MNFTCPRLPLLTLSFLLGAGAATAQDPRLAQPYAAGLLLNPALAGVTSERTATFVTRNQNPEAGNNFLTGALCLDARVAKVRGAVGIVPRMTAPAMRPSAAPSYKASTPTKPALASAGRPAEPFQAASASRTDR